jgi:hypothetical protein
MNTAKTINGFYGSNHTPCEIYTLDGWYVVDGSLTVNRTYEDIEDGVDVEELSDYDCFTWSSPINSEEELEAAINYGEEEEEAEEEPTDLELLIGNFINGNLSIALEQSKRFTLKDIRDALVDEYGYSQNKAFLTAHYLKEGVGFQSACDAE